MEWPRIVEHAAIVMSGLLLAEMHGKQLTRVVKRGLRVDYFVGDAPGDFSAIIEVGGTDKGNVAALRTAKHGQLMKSPLRAAPHWKAGFVAVTRFAPDAVSVLDHVAAGN
jgi:IS4 transposase